MAANANHPVSRGQSRSQMDSAIAKQQVMATSVSATSIITGEE